MTLIEGDKKTFNMLKSKIDKLTEHKDIDYYLDKFNSVDYLSKLKYKGGFILKYYSSIRDDARINQFIFHINTGVYGIVLRLNMNYCVKILTDKKYSHEYSIPLKIKETFDKNDSSYNKFLLIPSLFINNVNLKNFMDIIILHCLIIELVDKLIKKKQIKIPNLEIFKNTFYSQNYSTSILAIYTENFKNAQNHNDAIIFFTRLAVDIFGLNTILINNFEKIISILSYEKEKEIDKNFFSNCNLVFLPLAPTTAKNFLLNKDKQIFAKGYPFWEIDNLLFRYLFLSVSLFIIQCNKLFKYFSHNDLKPDNILVLKSTPFKIKLDEITYNMKEHFVFKIADYDFTNIEEIENKKIKSTIFIENKTWDQDIHFFIHLILEFYPKIYVYDKIFIEELKSRFNFCNYNSECTKYQTKNLKDINILIDFIKDKKYFSNWISKR